MSRLPVQQIAFQQVNQQGKLQKIVTELRLKGIRSKKIKVLKWRRQQLAPNSSGRIEERWFFTKKTFLNIGNRMCYQRSTEGPGLQQVSMGYSTNYFGR